MKTPPPLMKMVRAVMCALMACAAVSGMRGADEALFPTQNTFIRNGSAAQDNFGNQQRLELAGRTGDNNRKVYLKFELPEGAEGSTEGKLRLTVTGVIALTGEATNGFFPFKVYAAVGDNPDLWNESSLKWIDAPGNTGGAGEVDPPWVEVGSYEVQFPLNATEQTIEVALPGLPDVLKSGTGRALDLVLVPGIESAKTPGVIFYSTRVKGKSDQWPALLLTR